jgi:hypothetical protein
LPTLITFAAPEPPLQVHDALIRLQPQPVHQRR